jgi:hypothetical protein
MSSPSPQQLPLSPQSQSQSPSSPPQVMEEKLFDVLHVAKPVIYFVTLL